MRRIPPIRLAELLKANVFAYIGPAAFIERFNLENPRLRYVPAAPPFAADGYLEAQSRLGCFETFVSMDCDRAAAARLAGNPVFPRGQPHLPLRGGG